MGFRKGFRSMLALLHAPTGIRCSNGVLPPLFTHKHFMSFCPSSRALGHCQQQSIWGESRWRKFRGKKMSFFFLCVESVHTEAPRSGFFCSTMECLNWGSPNLRPLDFIYLWMSSLQEVTVPSSPDCQPLGISLSLQTLHCYVMLFTEEVETRSNKSFHTRRTSPRQLEAQTLNSAVKEVNIKVGNWYGSGIWWANKRGGITPWNESLPILLTNMSVWCYPWWEAKMGSYFLLLKRDCWTE